MRVDMLAWGERGSRKELDRVVQFERFGFVRIDGEGGVVAYFTHQRED